MRALIIILILAIVAYGIYRNLKIEDGTDNPTGSSGCVVTSHNEHHGEDTEPRPDDEDHEDATHE